MSLETIPACSSTWWGPDRAEPPRDGATLCCYSLLLVLLLANFLARTLARQRGFHAFLLTGFQVKGVALDFFNNVFLLHFALEAAQSVFEGFTLLQSNFRQTDTPPNPSRRTEQLLQGFYGKSRGEWGKLLQSMPRLTLIKL